MHKYNIMCLMSALMIGVISSCETPVGVLSSDTIEKDLVKSPALDGKIPGSQTRGSWNYNA